MTAPVRKFEFIKAPPADQNRRTPPWLFEKLQQVLRVKFVLDPAADGVNTMCDYYFDRSIDGLTQVWDEHTFCNPPFTNVGRWVQHACEQALVYLDKVYAVVGPAACSQQWAHRFAAQGTMLVPTERLVFLDSVTGDLTHGARQDTMIYVFGGMWWNQGFGDGCWSVRQLNVTGLVERS